MKLNEGLDVSDVASKDQTDITDARIRARQDATDAIAFVAFDAKSRYDVSHIPLLMDPGDMAFVKLHKGYRLPGLENPKLSSQRAGPFKILERIGNLAYKLELPPIWKAHPVISIAMLEPAPKGSDPYHRPREEGQDPIEDNEREDEDQDSKIYEIEILLDRRVVRPRGRSKKSTFEYVVKWKNCGPAHNVWCQEKDLHKSKDLMEEDYNMKFGLRSVREFNKRQVEINDVSSSWTVNVAYDGHKSPMKQGRRDAKKKIAATGPFLLTI